MWRAASGGQSRWAGQLHRRMALQHVQAAACERRAAVPWRAGRQGHGVGLQASSAACLWCGLQGAATPSLPPPHTTPQSACLSPHPTPTGSQSCPAPTARDPALPHAQHQPASQPHRHPTSKRHPAPDCALARPKPPRRRLAGKARARAHRRDVERRDALLLQRDVGVARRVDQEVVHVAHALVAVLVAERARVRARGGQQAQQHDEAGQADACRRGRRQVVLVACVPGRSGGARQPSMQAVPATTRQVPAYNL